MNHLVKKKKNILLGILFVAIIVCTPFLFGEEGCDDGFHEEIVLSTESNLISIPNQENFRAIQIERIKYVLDKVDKKGNFRTTEESKTFVIKSIMDYVSSLNIDKKEKENAMHFLNLVNTDKINLETDVNNLSTKQKQYLDKIQSVVTNSNYSKKEVLESLESIQKEISQTLTKAEVEPLLFAIISIRYQYQFFESHLSTSARIQRWRCTMGETLQRAQYGAAIGGSICGGGCAAAGAILGALTCLIK